MPATVITLKALQGGERTREEDVLRVLGKCWIFGCLQGQVLELPGKDLALIFLSLKKKKHKTLASVVNFVWSRKTLVIYKAHLLTLVLRHMGWMGWVGQSHRVSAPGWCHLWGR